MKIKVIGNEKFVLTVLLSVMLSSTMVGTQFFTVAKAARIWTVDDEPADPMAILAIDPFLSTADLGETFTVNLTVSNIFIDASCNGLYSWKVHLVFDPAVLQVVNASEGPFLKTAGVTYWGLPYLNNTRGLILAGATMFPPLPPSGATGNGTLASFIFLVKAERACLLHINYQLTALLTVRYYNGYPSGSIAIDYKTVDGYFYNIILPAHNVDTGLDYIGVQHAIDAHETLDGHTILVDAGMYYDNVHVYKSLNIIGAGSAGSTFTRIVANDPRRGVFVVTSNFVNISRFDITGASVSGITLWNVSYCCISDIAVTSRFGVSLEYSSSNHVVNVTAYSSTEGFHLYHTSNNLIEHSHIANNTYGINLLTASNNVIAGNNITNNKDGISLTYSSNNNGVYGNNITNSRLGGIELHKSSNNTFRSNIVAGSERNFIVWGWTYSHLINDIDSSNTVDGKPIYYWINKQDLVVPPDAGYVALVNCTHIEVKNVDLANNLQGAFFAYTTNSTITKSKIKNNFYGIQLLFSSNNIIDGNNVTNNHYGIFLQYSSNNSIHENNVTSNWYGIALSKSSNNSIWNNNFINNTHQVEFHFESTNLWDNGYPSGGNYWSDYIDIDVHSGPYQNETGSDGVWDHHYTITYKSADRYPLVEPWAPIKAAVKVHPDLLISNSKGKWITAHIELLEGHDMADIDVSTILLNDEIPAESSRNSRKTLIVKFDRSKVVASIPQANEVELTITGSLIDGTVFEGSDTIRVR